MNRPRRIRGLRIAVSAVFAILCVLLLAYGWRSYATCDVYTASVVDGTENTTYVQGCGFLSMQGRLYLFVDTPYHFTSWRMRSYPVDEVSFSQGMFTSANESFYCISHDLTVTHWFVAIVLASCGIIPWIGQSPQLGVHTLRFSLRTLLIATTLIAAVLGLVVYMSR